MRNSFPRFLFAFLVCSWLLAVPAFSFADRGDDGNTARGDGGDDLCQVE